MPRIIYITALLFSLITGSSMAQTPSLRQQIEQIISNKKADVGVSIYGIEDKDTLNINGDKHYPMQSVFKFPIAWTILDLVDKGKLALTQKIYIKKEDLLPGTWSPIKEKYPNGNVTLSLAEIMQYTVAQSDNNGCDILLRLAGGAEAVNRYIHQLGIRDIAIRYNEAAMHRTWEAQYANWITPQTATQMLALFYHNNSLSKTSFDFLWQTMLSTETGKNTIRGQLPARTPVAHKTGSSGTNDQGITAATNDIGIVTLPDGRHFAISVFVSDSKENKATNEKIIADIAKCTWDYFNRK